MNIDYLIGDGIIIVLGIVVILVFIKVNKWGEKK